MQNSQPPKPQHMQKRRVEAEQRVHEVGEEEDGAEERRCLDLAAS